MIYTNEEYLPHQSIVFTKNAYLNEFKLEKVILAYKNRIALKNTMCQPWELEIHPINFCGLNCIGCSYSDRHNDDKIDLEKLILKIKLYEKNGLKVVFFSGGGDPCGWNEWEEFIKRTKFRKWKLGISTNLFSVHHIKHVINKFDFLQLHIIGYDKESVQKESGVDAFETLDKNYNNLFREKKENQSITIKVLLRNSNYYQIDKYLSYIEKFNADSIVIKMEQDFLKNNNLYAKDLTPKIRKIIFKHPIIQKYDIILDNLDDVVFNYPKPKHCYIANSGLYRLIRANGEIYPCVAGTFDVKNCICKLGENEKIILDSHFDFIMNNEICPLHACRHYRFNNIIEKYNERKILTFSDENSSFLL